MTGAAYAELVQAIADGDPQAIADCIARNTHGNFAELVAIVRDGDPQKIADYITRHPVTKIEYLKILPGE